MTIDTKTLRLDFPYLTERCYLNTAAAGLSWAGQGAAVAQFYDSAKSRGINGRDEWRSRLDSVERNVRALLGDFAGHLNLLSNTTEALNLVAHSIEWIAGDEILVLADEFPSVLHAWHGAQTAGAKLVVVEAGDESERTAALCDAITGKTRVIAVSHVHWATGTAVDLQQLGRKCRDHGVLLVVDGIQAMGAIPVSLEFVDIYCGAVFKWLLSGFGLSILAVSQRASDQMRPAYIGYPNLPPERSLNYGHVNYPGIYALDATLEHLQVYGWPDIHAALARNAARLAAGAAHLGYTIAAPLDARAGIVSLVANDAGSLRDELAKRGIDVEERSGLLRCSPHFYNTDEDVDRLLDALSVLSA
jgi:cysteine desulfurase / selenocysteine lyase